MSKMDRILNSKKDKETIYEIYRACRLCGAGAGYKMPIIQNVIDLDDTDVELKQKIRECVQIEVHQDDKMPPLICELCVDKVNDFYEFLEMCRQTNKRTRLRLGLPPQSMPRGAPDAGDCILGLTEPVFVNEDSDGEPLAKHKKMQPKVKVKKEPELKVKLEKSILTGSRSTRFRAKSPTPPRITRHSKGAKDDNVSLSRLQDKSRSSSKTTPKSILKKEAKSEDTSLLTQRLKRSRDREPVKLETPVKKVKIAIKSPPSTPKSSPKSSPRVSKPVKPLKMAPPTSPSIPCSVCSQLTKTPQAAGNHMRSHTVTFTNPKMACNPCGLWFPTSEEAAAHHRQHKSKSKLYNCRRCTANFKHLSDYDEHFDKDQCIPWPEIPDVKCDVCWHLFPTNKLLRDHKCLGEEHRPGGRCSKCNRNYALLRNLKKHEETCTAKKKGEFTIDPVLLGKLRPFQVRVSRCDPLLTDIKQERYNVSSVAADFGLDKNCVYPYISSVFRIKSEPDGMVAINPDVKDEFFAENYVHWDEDSETDEELSCSLILNTENKRKIHSLATLSLKTIFSQKCLGKVPRKRRRVKTEKSLFDSHLGETEDDVTRDINNIIVNLGNDVDDDLFDKTTDGDDKDKSVESVDDKPNDDGDKSTDVVDKETDVVDNSNFVDQDKSNDIIGDKDSNKADDGNDSIEKKTDEANATVNEDNLVNNNEKSVAQNDVSLSESAKDSVKNDQIDEDVSSSENNSGAENNINDVNSACNDVTASNNNISSVNNDNYDGSKQTDGTFKVNNNSSTIKEMGVGNNDSKIASHVDVANGRLTAENKVSDDENQNNDVSVLNDDAKSTKNDLGSEGGSKNVSDCPISTSYDRVGNDNTQNDVSAANEKGLNDNQSGFEKPSDNDEIKTQIDEETVQNVSHDPKMSDLESKDDNQKSSQDSQSINTLEHSEVNDDIGTNYDKKNDIDVAISSDKSKNPTEPEDMDDTKLMEALDAEIGETNYSKVIENVVSNEKIALEDLISVKNVEKPMDLDIIPDEFNFDA